MKNDIDAQFLCKDCDRYNQCRYYHNRKEDSHICKYFEFHLAVPDKEPCEDATLKDIFCMGCEYKEQQSCPYWDYELKTCRHANIGALATKPYGDAISRQAVIDSIRNYFHDEYYQRTSIQDCRDCLIEDVIKSLPPVTPIRPKGEWKYDKTIQNWRCSKCNETPKTLGYVGTKEFMTEHFKFCNHCGADMRASEDM